MNKYKYILIAVVAIIIGGIFLFSQYKKDGGVNRLNGNPSSDSTLSKSTLLYKSSPRINEELTISIDDSSSASNYLWEVLSQPESSNLQLNKAEDGKSVKLTPTIAGYYKLKITSSGGESRETGFLVAKNFLFNVSKLEGYDSSQDLSKYSGMIINQVWVNSESLNKQDIETIVSKYPNFIIVDFDEVFGLLVEFDDSKPEIPTEIEKMKLEKGIDSVDFRVYEGENHTKKGLGL